MHPNRLDLVMISPGKHGTKRARLHWLIIWCCPLFAALGCMPPSSESTPPATKQEQGESRESLIRRTTREVRNTKEETADAGAQQAQSHLQDTNIIRYPFDTLLDQRSKLARIQIQSLIRGFYAEQGRYPKDYAEFKREIIDANPALQLPALPYYQEYGYDEEKHALIILEYPDRKKKR